VISPVGVYEAPDLARCCVWSAWSRLELYVLETSGVCAWSTCSYLVHCVYETPDLTWCMYMEHLILHVSGAPVLGHLVHYVHKTPDITRCCMYLYMKHLHLISPGALWMCNPLLWHGTVCTRST